MSGNIAFVYVFRFVNEQKRPNMGKRHIHVYTMLLLQEKLHLEIRLLRKYNVTHRAFYQSKASKWNLYSQSWAADLFLCI